MSDQEQVVAPAAPETQATESPIETTAPVEQQSTDATVEAESTESAPAKADEEVATSEPESDEKKPHWTQERINKLTREKYEARHEAQLYKHQLEQLKKPDDIPSKEPEMVDFTTVDDWQKAHKEWGVAEGKKAEREQTKRQSDEKQAREIRASLAAKEDAAVQKHSDYLATVNPVGEVIMSIPALREYVINEDMGTELAYYFGKNPSHLEMLQSMPSYQASRELLKLEAKLSAPPPPKPVTKAPDPIKPVGSNEKVRKSYEDMSMAEFARARREERRKFKG